MGGFEAPRAGQGAMGGFEAPRAGRVLTETRGFRGPQAVGLAGPGGASQQHEAGPAGVPHHGAHPPVVAIHDTIVVGIWLSTVHCRQEDVKSRVSLR